MNTAINLEFLSVKKDKTYVLKLFQKGKIVIAGLTTPYE